MSAPGRWLRLEVGWWMSDWLVGLPIGAQAAWVKLLCHAKTSGIGGRVKALGPAAVLELWKVQPEDLEAMIAAAVADQALQVSDGFWVLTKWAMYQDPDRTAADRQRRHRKDRSRLSPLRRDTRDTPLHPVTPRDSRCDPSRATETLTLTVTDTSKPLGSSGDDPAFEEAWKAYPRRQGGNPKKLALQAWRARIREGIPAGDLVAAVHRYRAHVEATERMGTEFVLQAATFFGPKERWKDDFGTVKPNGNGNGRYRTSGEEWARNPGLIRHE